ncbi:MAG TPA: hypothetical protein ACQGQH_03710 [Xylella sp.]
MTVFPSHAERAAFGAAGGSGGGTQGQCGAVALDACPLHSPHARAVRVLAGTATSARSAARAYGGGHAGASVGVQFTPIHEQEGAKVRSLGQHTQHVTGATASLSFVEP